MSGNKVNIDLAKREGQKFTGSVNVKRMLEDDVVVSTKATTTVTIAEQRFDILRNQEMHLCIGAVGQNYAGNHDVTFKFYRKIENTPYLAETVVVKSPAADVGLAGIVSVNTTRNIDDYDYYTIEGTLTVVHSGESIGDVRVSVGKKTEGKRLGDSGDPLNVTGTSQDAGVEIDGTDSASITDTSSTVTLTQKSGVRNTGTNTVYICEGSGTATDADFPIYPDETITLKAGTFDAICGAGLSSTLKILQVS